MLPLLALESRSLLKIVKARCSSHGLHHRRHHHLVIRSLHLLEALRALAHRGSLHRKAHHCWWHCSVRLIKVVELRNAFRLGRQLGWDWRISAVVLR